MLIDDVHYTECWLTNEQKAVVDAMEAGAKVDVILHNAKELSEVDEVMNLFKEFETKTSWIKEKKLLNSESYISFSKELENVSIGCFMDL